MPHTIPQKLMVPFVNWKTRVQKDHRRRDVLRVAIAVIAVGLVIGSTQFIIRYAPVQSVTILRVLLSLAVATLCWCVARRHQRLWVTPVRLLEQIITEIRKGHAPIDELQNIDGGIAPIAAQVGEILHELRLQKAAVAELNEEIRQRVASRTNALERTIQSLRHQATRDPLTGLYNRRMLDQLLPRMIRQALGRTMPLSVLMIDVDHFKDLNDTLGHAAGDEMLRSLGQLIHSTIREGDVGFRCGGDEFVVLLPGSDHEAARILSDRLQSLTAGLTSTMKLGRRPKLSVGISSMSDVKNPTAQTLLHRADELLYAAKASRKGSTARTP